MTEKAAVFSVENARTTLESVCMRTGLNAANAELIRMGENALFVLPDHGVVARIARNAAYRQRVERELAVARWLAGQGFPTVRVAEELPQPIELDQRLVTFWHLVEIVGKATLEDLAGLLREFHALPEPEFRLPQFDPFSVVPIRLANPGKADPAHVEYLTEMYESLRTRYGTLEFDSPLGVIHGDAHRANVMLGPDGPLLSDYEVVAWGPREWDLTTTALGVDRFGVPRVTYDSYVRSYGRDVTEWPGYPVLRGIRELTMTTWLMQLVGDSPDRAKEFDNRIASLRAGDVRWRWNAF